ncbi:hypothetical protein WMY93_007395 [Mugilogobius chulae]|uniref:Uncharacterized protein n=1 Tax=Mugilogobius chulae TaxID=88201 RepID=A0AAW0PNJ5_9GOBI
MIGPCVLNSEGNTSREARYYTKPILSRLLTPVFRIFHKPQCKTFKTNAAEGSSRCSSLSPLHTEAGVQHGERSHRISCDYSLFNHLSRGSSKRMEMAFFTDKKLPAACGPHSHEIRKKLVLLNYQMHDPYLSSMEKTQMLMDYSEVFIKTFDNIVCQIKEEEQEIQQKQETLKEMKEEHDKILELLFANDEEEPFEEGIEPLAETTEQSSKTTKVPVDIKDQTPISVKELETASTCEHLEAPVSIPSSQEETYEKSGTTPENPEPIDKKSDSLEELGSNTEATLLQSCSTND